MGMGQGIRSGIWHGGSTCVLQTQFSSLILSPDPYFSFLFLKHNSATVRNILMIIY